MNTETATSATPEAVCSTAMLGPVRRALDGLVFAAHQAGEYEKQLGDSADVLDWIEYVMCEVAAEREAAVAAERERLAAACWERRGHFASEAAARAFAELVRDGLA